MFDICHYSSVVLQGYYDLILHDLVLGWGGGSWDEIEMPKSTNSPRWEDIFLKWCFYYRPVSDFMLYWNMAAWGSHYTKKKAHSKSEIKEPTSPKDTM